MQRPDFAPQLFETDASLPSGTEKRDMLARSLEELFFIEHPTVQKNDPELPGKMREFVSSQEDVGIWTYYPLERIAVRIPSEETYFRLRTARNRDLITDAEQRSYRSAFVGIAGLSVGSSAVHALVATGGPKRMRLADPDTIEITNLNRIEAGIPELGANKTDVAARAVWARDPFAEIELWRSGIPGRVEEFIDGLQVFVDEMDDIALKFACREACKARGIPVVMATDNGDGAILDIERFDEEPGRPVFHGRVEAPTMPLDLRDKKEFVKLANQIIDPSLFSTRQLESVQRVGKELPGVPQLGTAAAIAGAIAACAVRAITTGEKLRSGRYRIGYELMQSS